MLVLRTSVPREVLDTNETVGAYKSLSQVERAFRSLKTIELKIRPIHHRLAERVKAHVFRCMLASYVEWHMQSVLAPILFDDHDPSDAASSRPNRVVPAERSRAASGKRQRRSPMMVSPFTTFQPCSPILPPSPETQFYGASG